jgi:hypothetical protein
MAVAGPLASRRKVIQVALETDRGTAVVPDLPALAFDPQINTDAPFIERKPHGASGGHATGFLGERVGSASFRLEMRGSGSSATFDPALAALLQCCGLKLSTGVYKPCHPVDQKCCTIYVHEDGLLKSLHGCAGNVKIEGERGKPCYASFEMKGVWAAPTDVALATVSHNATVPPRVSSCTFTLDSATPYIAGFSLDLGNDVQPREDVNSPEGTLHYYVADRGPVITLSPEMQLVATYDWFGKWTGLSALAFSILVGSATNNKFTLAAPALQIRKLSESDRAGKAANDIECQCCYSGGDDEVSLTPG